MLLFYIGSGPPPPATLSEPPKVVELFFPSTIPPDGSKQKGFIRFHVVDESVTLLQLEVLEAKDFTPQEFKLGPSGQWDLLPRSGDGRFREGRFEFELGSSTPQLLIRLRATLIDRRNRRSEPWDFSFSVEGKQIDSDLGVILVGDPWGRAGSGDGEFKSSRHLTVDKDGNIYVADTGNNRIQKFDSRGNFIAKWGSYGTGHGEFNAPSGITVDREGNLYVTDSLNHRIQKFAPDGTFLKIDPDKTPKPVDTLGVYGKGLGQFYAPYAVVADSRGNFYVADTFNHRIQKFNSRGEIVHAWGEHGDLDEKFKYPWGLAVDTKDNVYVVDSGNHRIQKFDANGQRSETRGSKGSTTGQFKQPWGIAVDLKGNIYVVDSHNHRVQKFSAFWKFLGEWGRYGNGPGEFAYPIGIAIDDQGYIYVADSGNNRIQKFWVNK